jgi:hypothetical protein
MVRCRNLGAGGQQCRHRHNVTVMGRPMQRGRAVGLRRIDIRTCFEVSADPGPISLFGGVSEGGSRLGRKGVKTGKQNGERKNCVQRRLKPDTSATLPIAADMHCHAPAHSVLHHRSDA